jgi:predicted phage terminase large subunit-like protein
MTPDEIATCRTDLLAFTQHMFQARKGEGFKLASHHAKICTALERVVTGQINRLIINIPPRSGKTEIAVKNFIAWCMGNFPDSEFIHASYSKRLATTNTWEARSIMQHEAYAEIFGPPAFRDDSNAKDEFRTQSGGIVYATGAEGTITGYGAGKMRDTFGGCIIVDDPHKAGEGNSDTMRQNVLDWFGVTLESRKNRPDTPIIVIMQRLHELDLSGWLLSGGNGEHWDHLDIPARDASGESFWPEQFPPDMLARLESTNAYVFAGQYMQRPAPIGGGIFKDEWWQYYIHPPQLEWRAIYADTAQKTGQMNDYSVFECWGKSVTGQAVLLDMIRGKWEAPELQTEARAFWNKHKAIETSPLRKMAVEDKVSGTGLIQTLKREGIPVIPIQRDRDKVTRAYDAAPLVQSGNVLLPQNAPWLSDLLGEATAFPNAAHDDIIDPLMDAVTDIVTPSGGTVGMILRKKHRQ